AEPPGSVSFCSRASARGARKESRCFPTSPSIVSATGSRSSSRPRSRLPRRRWGRDDATVSKTRAPRIARRSGARVALFGVPCAASDCRRDAVRTQCMIVVESSSQGASVRTATIAVVLIASLSRLAAADDVDEARRENQKAVGAFALGNYAEAAGHYERAF